MTMSGVGDVANKDFLCKRKKCGFMGKMPNGVCPSCGSKKIRPIQSLLGKPTDTSVEMCTENPNFKMRP